MLKSVVIISTNHQRTVEIMNNFKNKKSIIIIAVIVILLALLILGLTGHIKTSNESLTSSDLTSTPESAASDSDTNADGYGEETLTLTEDGYAIDGITIDGETSSTVTSSDETDSNLTAEETVEQPVATMPPQVTSTPAPVQATPQPVATNPPQQAVTQQPEQSYDDGGSVPDWVDDSWTGYGDDSVDWGDTVLE